MPRDCLEAGIEQPGREEMLAEALLYGAYYAPDAVDLLSCFLCAHRSTVFRKYRGEHSALHLIVPVSVECEYSQ